MDEQEPTTSQVATGKVISFTMEGTMYLLRTRQAELQALIAAGGTRVDELNNELAYLRGIMERLTTAARLVLSEDEWSRLPGPISES